MTYSMDLRKRVVEFVATGGSKSEASRRFSVSRWCVMDWCNRDDLKPKAYDRQRRKFDWELLKKDVTKHPDRLLRERAKQFNVAINAVWYAMGQLGFTHKKNFSLLRKKP